MRIKFKFAAWNSYKTVNNKAGASLIVSESCETNGFLLCTWVLSIIALKDTFLWLLNRCRNHKFSFRTRKKPTFIYEESCWIKSSPAYWKLQYYSGSYNIVHISDYCQNSWFSCSVLFLFPLLSFSLFMFPLLSFIFPSCFRGCSPTPLISLLSSGHPCLSCPCLYPPPSLCGSPCSIALYDL